MSDASSGAAGPPLEPPEPTVPDSGSTRIGVDEWVSEAERRTHGPSGFAGAVLRFVDRVPKLVPLAAFAAVVATLPVLTSNEYVLRVATNTLLYALLALGLNVAVGWAGLLDLGYIAFYGFAAYIFAELSSPHYGLHWPTWGSVPAAILGTVVLGFLLALPSRRLAGDYLAIVTLFFGQLFVTLTTQGYRLSWLGFGGTHDVTGGPTGLTQVDPFRIFGHELVQVRDYLWAGLGAFVLVAVALHFLENSRTGRAWRGLREDPLAAELMGIPINRLKLLAVAIGAGVAGVAGTINAAYFQGVFPTSFDFPLLITIYAMVILGGAGSLMGVVTGAIVVNVLLELLTTPDHARWVFYGVILLALATKLRPWRLLAAVLTGLVAFGMWVTAIVGAVWPRGTAGPVFVSNDNFTREGWIPETLRHWLVLPAHTYDVPNYQLGNYAFVLAIALVLAVTVVRGWARYMLLVPTIWVAAVVWEVRLVEEAPTTRPLLLGTILIVLMAARPQGLFGTPRVEIG